MTWFAAIIPFIYLWRFGKARLDRDYVCYAYGGLYGGYLRNGHQDIKPPAIHWGYTSWLWLLKSAGLGNKLGIELKLRLFPALGASASIALVGFTQGAGNAWILALLWASPFCWQHMANTEWLTGFLLACWLALYHHHPATAWLICGLMVWVNQKNVLIVALCLAVAFLDGRLEANALTALAPSALLGLVVAFNKRWRKYLVDVPRQMTNNRTLRVNTLDHFHILRPWLQEAVMLIPFLDFSTPIPLLFFGSVALLIYSKQIMPHHFIIVALCLAIAIKPGLPAFMGLLLAMCIRSLPVWLKPSRLYPATFSYVNSSIPHYGVMLEDSKSVEAWLKANTKEDEPIYVNGMEAQIYTYSGRKSVGLPIWELPRWQLDPMYENPRVVVHCLSSGWLFDDKGYTLQMVSKYGIFMVYTLNKGEQ